MSTPYAGSGPGGVGSTEPPRSGGAGFAGTGSGAAQERERLDTLVGLMSATAIFLGLLGATNLNLSISGTHLAMRPIRIGVAAVVLALVASGIGGRHSRLATAAVAIAGASWVLGMVIAVVTERPLF